MFRSISVLIVLGCGLLWVDGLTHAARAVVDVCPTVTDVSAAGTSPQGRNSALINDTLFLDGSCNSATDSIVATVALQTAGINQIAVILNTFDANSALNDTGLNIIIDSAYVVDSITTTINNIQDLTPQNVESFYYPTVETADAFKSVIQITRTVGGEVFNFTVEKAAGTNILNSITFFNAPLPGAGGDGATESETLSQQQRAASTLVVNFQSRTLGDGVFDHLGDAFNGGGSGPQVSENGFSASTTSVANWINQKQQQKFAKQLADLPRDENGNDIYVAPVAALFPRHQRKWNAWINGNWTYYDGDGSSFDGHTIDVLAGFDYKVDDSVVIGLLGGYGNTDFDTVTGGTKGAFEADGYTVGPYVGIKLSNNVQFDALAAYTYSDYDNRVGVTSGDFMAHRVTVGARLKGRWEHDNFFIEPGVRLMYAEEDQNSYTDSAGVRQSSLTIKAGRVSIGPKIGYTHKTESGESIRPWVSVRGEYDFSNQNNAPTSGLPDLDDLLSARVSAGVDATTRDGINVSVHGDVSGLGSGEYTAYGGTARIDVPF